jgi:membrane-associated phospholipid phosphatase
MLELSAKFLSVLPFYYFIFLGMINTYLIFTNIIQFKRLFLYTLGIISATLFSEIIKKCVTPVGILKNFWYRPKGAKGCDYLSIKGFAPDFTPGCPSGHMSTTSYFVIYNILLLYKYWPTSFNRITIVILNLVFLGLMGWARMYKKCHTLTQVIGGTIFGGIIATIFYRIDSLV